jgi:hypothetical protein
VAGADLSQLPLLITPSSTIDEAIIHAYGTAWLIEEVTE